MRKENKEETWTFSFIEEAWICRTGSFSAILGQPEASAKRLRRAGHVREECKKKKPRKKHLYPYAHQDRETTKDILRILNS